MANYRKDGLTTTVFSRQEQVNGKYHKHYEKVNFPSNLLAQLNWGAKSPQGVQPNLEVLKNRLLIRHDFRLYYYATYKTTDDQVEEVQFAIGNLEIAPADQASSAVKTIQNPHDSSELANELARVTYFNRVDPDLSRLRVRISLGLKRDWVTAETYSFEAFQNHSLSRVKLAALKPEDRANIQWLEYLMYLARLDLRAQYQATEEKTPYKRRPKGVSQDGSEVPAKSTGRKRKAEKPTLVSKLEAELKQAKLTRNDCLLKLGSLNIVNVLEQEINACAKEFGVVDIYRKCDVAWNMLSTRGVYNSAKAASEAMALEHIQCFPSAATNDDWNDQWNHVSLHPNGLFKRHEGYLQESPNDYLQLFCSTIFNARSLRNESIELISDGFSRESTSSFMDGVEYGYNGSADHLTSQKRILFTWDRLSGAPLSIRVNEGSLNDLFAYYRQLAQIKDALSYTALVDPFTPGKIPESYKNDIVEGEPLYDVQQVRHMHDRGLNMPEIIAMHLALRLPVAAFMHLTDQKIIDKIESSLKANGPLALSREGIRIRINEIRKRLEKRKKLTPKEVDELSNYYFTIKMTLQETGWAQKLKNRAKDEDPNGYLFKWLVDLLSQEEWKELRSEEITFVVMPSYIALDNYRREMTQLLIDCELHNNHNPKYKPLKKSLVPLTRAVRLHDIPLLKDYDLEDDLLKATYDEYFRITALPKNEQLARFENLKQESWEYKAEAYKASQSKKAKTNSGYKADNPVMFYLPNYEAYKAKFNNGTYKVLVHTCKTSDEAYNMIQFRGDIEPNFSDFKLIGTKSCQVSSDKAFAMKLASELLAVTFKKVVLARNDEVIKQLRSQTSEKANKLRINDFYQWLNDLDGYKVHFNYASNRVKNVVEISARCRLAWEKIGMNPPTLDHLNALLNAPRKERDRLRKLSGKLTLLEKGDRVSGQ